MKTFSLTILAFFTSISLYAQICFTYDAAGNRIGRRSNFCDLVEYPNDPPNPNSGQDSLGRQAQISVIESLELSFYPNPSTEIFTLKSNQDLIGSTVRIIDLQGRLVLQEQLKNNELNMSYFPVGLYQISVFYREEVRTFLVEKID